MKSDIDLSRVSNISWPLAFYATVAPDPKTLVAQFEYLAEFCLLSDHKQYGEPRYRIAGKLYAIGHRILMRATSNSDEKY